VGKIDEKGGNAKKAMNNGVMQKAILFGGKKLLHLL
jgi:hypothetical protein